MEIRLQNIAPQFDPYLDLEGLRKQINQIHMGKRVRIIPEEMKDCKLDFYFRLWDFKIESKYGIVGDLDVLFCDGFSRTGLIHENVSHSLNYMSVILDEILKNFNVVFVKWVPEIWEEKDPELLAFIRDNYRTHEIRIHPSSFHKEGLFLPKQISLDLILEGNTSVPYNKLKVSNNLIRVRKRLGFTQGQLADKSGLHQKTIGNIECQRTFPALKSVELLSNALEVDISNLLN